MPYFIPKSKVYNFGNFSLWFSRTEGSRFSLFMPLLLCNVSALQRLNIQAAIAFGPGSFLGF